jgi:hypothetical protein
MCKSILLLHDAIASRLDQRGLASVFIPAHFNNRVTFVFADCPRQVKDDVQSRFLDFGALFNNTVLLLPFFLWLGMN